MRAAAEVDAAHLVDRQRAHVVDVALHDPLEAVADAEHLDPLEQAADRGRADDAVDAGGGPAPDQDRQSLLMAHVRHLELKERRERGSIAPARGRRARGRLIHPAAARACYPAILGWPTRTGTTTLTRTHASRGRLTAVLALTCAFLVVEVAAGLLTGSLALLADAGHMLTDVAGLVLALLAMKLAERPRLAAPHLRLPPGGGPGGAHERPRCCWAWRATSCVEAWERFRDPQPVPSGTVLLVAAVGLLVNLAGALLLRAGARDQPQPARRLQRGRGRRALVGRRDRRARW